MPRRPWSSCGSCTTGSSAPGTIVASHRAELGLGGPRGAMPGMRGPLAAARSLAPRCPDRSLDHRSADHHAAMPSYRLTRATDAESGLYDITAQVRQLVATSGVSDGLVNVYVRGATAGIMIQENWDDSVQRDVVTLLRELIPQGRWEHDRQDGNGHSHLKAGLVGPSECIPLADGQLLLSTWQNIFLCEFDGPRKEREVVVTVLAG